MGQLEKYGLYVLCLVICLILGVAIWGGDPGSASVDRTELERTAAAANARASGPAANRDAAWFDPVRSESAGPRKVSDLELAPADRDPPAPPPAPAKDGAADAPLPKTTPVPPAIHVVRKGETIEEIAIQHLGSRARMRELLVLNPEIKDPRRDLREGMKLRLPHGQVQANDKKLAAGPKENPRGTAKDGVWQVRDGDNPHKIAATVLKAPVNSSEVAKFAEEMLRLNNIGDETRLRIGAELRLPPVRK
jgi:hypothetical protein